MSAERAPRDAHDAAAVRRMFGRIAARYDLNNRLHSLGRDQAWRRAAAQAAALRPGETVLDLACGTGDLAMRLARAGARVTAADFCPEMLEVARRRARALEIDWVAADALALPFRAGAFDALTVAFGVRNFADLGRGLGECRRVLRPGGRLVVLEFNGEEARGPVGRLAQFYIRRLLPRSAAFIAGDRAGAYDYLQRSVRGFLTAGQLAEAIRRAGFPAVQTRRLTLGLVSVHRAGGAA